MKSTVCLRVCTTSALLAALLLQPSAYAAATAQEAGPVGSSQQFGQQSSPPASQTTQNNPVFARIATARSAFLSNSGVDAGFPIDATRAYNDLYAALQDWGHYRLVASPDQAELIFELHGAATITGVSGYDGNIASTTNSVFQLKIMDAKTKVVLWTVTSPVYAVGRKQVLQRWVSLSERNLVSRIKALAGEPLSATETAELTVTPPNHTKRVILLFGGLAAAGALTGTLLYRHAVSNGKKSQDDFCTAHNIPLNMCPGG